LVFPGAILAARVLRSSGLGPPFFILRIRKTAMAKKVRATKKAGAKRVAKRAKRTIAKKVSAGTVSVSTAVDFVLATVSPSKGVRLGIKHLGIAAGADTVSEISGNNRYLDPTRPPIIDGGDVLVFFDPELLAGNYGFKLKFTYQEEMEPVIPAPLNDGKYNGVVK
jgi:hypothetical protein